jgi:hypothetical protein
MMKLSRRELLKTTGTLGAGLGLASVGAMNALVRTRFAMQ